MLNPIIQYLDEETVEQFEDRVLNKRAAQVNICVSLNLQHYKLICANNKYDQYCSCTADLGREWRRPQFWHSLPSPSWILSPFYITPLIHTIDLIPIEVPSFKFNIRRKDTRKIAAQKFYSLLVLQKVRILHFHLQTLPN